MHRISANNEPSAPREPTAQSGHQNVQLWYILEDEKPHKSDQDKPWFQRVEPISTVNPDIVFSSFSRMR